MRLPISKRRTPPKLINRLHPFAPDPIGLNKKTNSKRSFGQKLNKKIIFIAFGTSVAAAILFTDQENKATQIMTEQPSVAVTNNEAIDTTATQAPITEQSIIAASPPKTPEITTHEHSNNLSIANTEAITSARNGNITAAIKQLEQALINDPQAGILFSNLRNLYTGLASQSYQLAIDPTNKQTAIVELSDQQTKYTIKLPATPIQSHKPQTTNNDNNHKKTMPTLPTGLQISVKPAPIPDLITQQTNTKPIHRSTP